MNEIKRDMSGTEFKMWLGGVLGALWLIEMLLHAVGVK